MSLNMSNFPTIPEVHEHARVANVLREALHQQLSRDKKQAVAFVDVLQSICEVLHSGAPVVSPNTYEHREALAPLMAAYGVEFVPHEREIGKFRIAKIGADLDSAIACGAQPAAGMSIAQAAQQQIKEICGLPAKVIVAPSKLNEQAKIDPRWVEGKGRWNFPKASR